MNRRRGLHANSASYQVCAAALREEHDPSLARLPSNTPANLSFAAVLATLALGYVVLGAHDFARRIDQSAFLRPVSALPLIPANLLPLPKMKPWTLHVSTPTLQGQVQQTLIQRHKTQDGEVLIVEDTWPRGATARRAYRIGPHGLALLATQLGQSAFLDPALLLLPLPLKTGQVGAWSGSVRVGKRRYPAHAALRVNGPDPITTPAGDFHAYRIDLLLTLGSGKGQSAQHLTLWLAPGVGIVREVQGTEATGLLCELAHFGPPQTNPTEEPQP